MQGYELISARLVFHPLIMEASSGKGRSDEQALEIMGALLNMIGQEDTGS